MSGFVGADVAQLRELARAFQAASDRLERNRMTVANQIKISAWAGPFAASFRVNWESEHTVHIAAVARALSDNATRLRKNADEQDGASRAESAQPRGNHNHAVPSTGHLVVGPAAPTSTSGYVKTLDGMKSQDDGVRVQKIRGADGVERFIVYISGSGSTRDGRLFDGNSVDGMLNGRLAWGNNGSAAFGLDSETLRGIRESIDRQMKMLGGDRESEVMIVGFSQGGMIAQSLADDSSFNTKEVLTYGSPDVLAFRNDGGANVMHLRHNSDLVPGFDAITKSPFSQVVAGAIDFVARADKPAKGDVHTFVGGTMVLGGAHDAGDYGWLADRFDESTDPRDVAVRERYEHFQGTIVGDSEDPYDAVDSNGMPEGPAAANVA